MKTAAMNRPTTPTFNFVRQAGPSSPPETPTTSSFAYKNRRHGMHFTQPLPPPSEAIKSNGCGPTFNYHPSVRPAELSPRSSSPDSNHSSSSSSGSGSPPRSRSPSSEPGEPVSDSPPRNIPTRVVTQASFVLEEITESDLDDFDSDDEDNIIRPHQYEDADSDRAHSIKAAALASDLKNLQLRKEADNEEIDREAWLEELREQRRRKRRSSGSVQKRTISQSIGSDTDEEDLQPMQIDANEAGSSARRLRRKVGERTSLIFDDPPPRIEELEEPESCEELIAVDEDESGEDEDGQGVDRELPYYMQMDVDSDEEESSDEDEWNSLRAMHMTRNMR